MAKADLRKVGIDRKHPPAELPQGFRWSQAYQVVENPKRATHPECPSCLWPIKPEQYARDLIGLRLKVQYHDDCVEAIDFERPAPADESEETVEPQVTARFRLPPSVFRLPSSVFTASSAARCRRGRARRRASPTSPSPADRGRPCTGGTLRAPCAPRCRSA